MRRVGVGVLSAPKARTQVIPLPNMNVLRVPSVNTKTSPDRYHVISVLRDDSKILQVRRSVKPVARGRIVSSPGVWSVLYVKKEVQNLRKVLLSVRCVSMGYIRTPRARSTARAANVGNMLATGAVSHAHCVRAGKRKNSRVRRAVSPVNTGSIKPQLEWRTVRTVMPGAIPRPLPH